MSVFRLAAALFCGAFAAVFWPRAPHIAIVALGMCPLIAWRCRSARLPVLAGTAMLLWASAHAAHTRSARVPEPASGRLTACITGPVWLIGSRLRFDVLAREFDGRPVSWRLVATSYGGVRVPRPGQCWVFDARVRPPRGRLNRTGPDAEKRAFRHRVAGYARVQLDRSATRLTRRHSVPLTAARLALADQLRFAVGEGAAWPLIVALAVGYRDVLPVSLHNALVSTGTRHLVSISGLHIGLVAAAGWWIGRGVIAPLFRCCCPRWWARRGGDRWAGPVIAWVLAVLYALLAGFALPTRRALLMLAVWLLVSQIARRVPVTSALLLAACGILILDPFALLDHGFWLSFGAVAVLASLRLRVQAPWWQTQWVAFVGLLPVVTVTIGRLSLVGPLANLVWVPLVSLVLVPAVLFTVIALVLPVPMVAHLAGGLARLIDPALVWLFGLAALPFSELRLSALGVTGALLALIGVALLLVPGARPRNRALAVALCLPLFFGRADRPAHGEVRLDVLDVSHGLAVVIYTQRHVVLYDTGGQWARTDAVARVVGPHLSATGVRQVHTVVISHGDLDHRGGAASLSSFVSVANWWSGEPERGGRGRLCREGLRWRLDGVVFEFLHPRRSMRWRGNNASCVLRVTTRFGSALLTGDLERLGEVSLLHGRNLRPARIVVGQHHGSRTSSSAAFVRAVQADFALFSTSFDNRWSLPAREVVSRWQAAGTMTCHTAASGGLTVWLDGRAAPSMVTGARQARPALWRWSNEAVGDGWWRAFRTESGRDILRASC